MTRPTPEQRAAHAQQIKFDTIEEAVQRGEAVAVRNAADPFPWDHYPSRFVDILLDVQGVQNHDEVAEAFVVRALRDGRPDVFDLHNVTIGKFVFVTPVLDMIIFDQVKTLAHYLKAGFDPERRHGAEGRTAIEIADQLASSKVHDLLRAHCVRKRTNELLDASTATPSESRVAL